MVDALSWEILNATADDWESLEQIKNAVQRFLGPCNEKSIAEEISKLVRQKLFEQKPLSVPVEESWFRMTALGREVWKSSMSHSVSQSS